MKHTEVRMVVDLLGQRRKDTEVGMLSGISQKNNMRSGSCWFTEFCNSQCLSHFAAPFNTARAETFIAESCECFIRKQWTVSKRMHQMVAPVAQVSRDQPVRDTGREPAKECQINNPRVAPHRKLHMDAVTFARMILPQVHLRKPCYDFSFL